MVVSGEVDSFINWFSCSFAWNRTGALRPEPFTVAARARKLSLNLEGGTGRALYPKPPTGCTPGLNILDQDGQEKCTSLVYRWISCLFVIGPGGLSRWHQATTSQD
jgi:hypothetical protein